MVRRAAVLFFLSASVMWLPAARADEHLFSDIRQELRHMARKDDNEIDLAVAKLHFDQQVDPSIDLQQGLLDVNHAAEAALRMAGGASATARAKLTALRDYLYASGEWNDDRPFQYDQTDPLGNRIQTKLLANYLRTRRGNCVTMPMYFLILADRLGLDATLALAPHHIFVQMTDPETGRVFNLETTSGAHVTRDAWYRENMPMTDIALHNGLYLRGLKRKEIVALMATTVVESLSEKGRYAEAIVLADEILKIDPLNVHALLSRGNAAGLALEQYGAASMASTEDSRSARQTQMKELIEINESSFRRAEDLGWQPETNAH